MTYWQDSHRTLYNHDCRKMPELADNSVQMVVTSPPYWGLRKYAGEQDLVWGGNQDCQHEWGADIQAINSGGGWNNPETRVNYPTMRLKNPEKESSKQVHQGNFCSLCGAWRGSFGLEPTPELYVAHTIEILSEIKRVLRKDGVCFWNIADSYSGSGGTGNQFGQIEKGIGVVKPARPSGVIKPKDLVLIPFRVAIAAQEAGWWVRSVIIWNKPNPMPESVTDRPTESHEYILMLTKSARYYYDAEAVREAYTEPLDRWGGPCTKPTDESKGDDFSVFERPGRERRPNPSGRNLRSVWTFPTQPYSGAHFATYPEKLVEICVKAGTPEYGCCSKCGKPWERIVEKKGGTIGKSWHDHSDDIGQGMSQEGCSGLGNKTNEDGEYQVKTLGWQPACKCNATTIPSTVLDPFSGSGTTLKVSAELNRRAVGYELSEEYCKLAIKRNQQGVIL